MSESTVFRALDSAMHKVRAKAQAQLVEKMRELRDPGAA
jgi:DNA-binding CsgD family transcriptional regulator